MTEVLWVIAGALVGLDVGCVLVFLVVVFIVVKEGLAERV